MPDIRLSITLTQGEAQDAFMVLAQGMPATQQGPDRKQLALQMGLGVGLVAAAFVLTALFGAGSVLPALFSALLGGFAILVLLRYKAATASAASVRELLVSTNEYGPMEAVFDDLGIRTESSIGTARLPWKGVGAISPGTEVTVIRFGLQAVIVPHRVLPQGMDGAEFAKRLEEWKAAA